jgi:hypothetical protein
MSLFLCRKIPVRRITYYHEQGNVIDKLVGNRHHPLAMVLAVLLSSSSSKYSR